MRCAGGWRPWQSSASGADAEPSRVPARRDRNLNARASASPWSESGTGAGQHPAARGPGFPPPSSRLGHCALSRIGSFWLGPLLHAAAPGRDSFRVKLPVTWCIIHRLLRSRCPRTHDSPRVWSGRGAGWVAPNRARLSRPLPRPSAHTATQRQHSSGGGNRADRPNRLARPGADTAVSDAHTRSSESRPAPAREQPTSHGPGNGPRAR